MSKPVKYAKPGKHQQWSYNCNGRPRPQVSNGDDLRHLSVRGKSEKRLEELEIDRLAVATLGDWDYE